jgi:cis-3-alkyl-4-acyloxetan-2-one decarboxylase
VVMIDSCSKKEFPFKSNFLKLPISNLKLHYIDEGKGDPILCIHGNPTWAFYFRKIISKFKNSQRVIAYDHIGCGYSSRTDDLSYSLEKHIENLTHLVKTLDLKNITLLVHDWGGAIGCGFAVKHRDKIKQIIITNTSAFYSPDTPKRIKILKTPIIGEYLIKKLNIFARAATIMASAKGLSQETKKSFLAPYHNSQSRSGIANFIKDIPLNKYHPTYTTLKQIEKCLPQFKKPVLILWGMKDFCFHKKFLEKWKSIYPHATIFEKKQAGHYLFEDAEQFCLEKIKDFLEK